MSVTKKSQKPQLPTFSRVTLELKINLVALAKQTSDKINTCL